MGTPSISTLGRFAISDEQSKGGGDWAATVANFASGVHASNSYEYEFITESVRLSQSHIYNSGLRGTRSRHQERVQIGTERAGGSIVMEPTPVELDQWLPRILGTAELTDVFALSETLFGFSALFDRVAARHVYTGLYVSRATFACGQGQNMVMSLDVEGTNETQDTSTAFPACDNAIDAGAPYVFDQCTFSFTPSGQSAVTSEIRDYVITIDNGLDTGRYMNSKTRAKLPALDRAVGVQITLPYTTDERTMHDQLIAGMDSAFIKMTAGNRSILWTFGNLKSPANTPVIGSRGSEIVQTLDMQAYKTGSTNELVVTNDSSAQ